MEFELPLSPHGCWKIGLTWQKVSRINACPWFDRVDTKSNPVDGLSRGDLSGDWDVVTLVFPGPELSAPTGGPVDMPRRDPETGASYGACRVGEPSHAA